MRVIQLYTAEPDKKGIRREAGEELTVGTDAKSDIDPKRAKELVDRKAAVVVTAAKAPSPKRPTAKKASKRKAPPAAKPTPPAPAAPAPAETKVVGAVE
jgi:hypothetical protein